MTDPWPDLLVVKKFLDPFACREIGGEMNTAEGAAATVYGRGLGFRWTTVFARRFPFVLQFLTVQLVSSGYFSSKPTSTGAL